MNDEELLLPPAPPDEPEPTRPIPPRYWWLKRLGLAGALLTVTLGGVWAAWAREAGRRLGRELQPVIAAGEPVNAVGMNPPRIPDEENGALLYRRASKILNRTVQSPANSQIDYDGYPPFPPRWHKLADRAIPANAPSLALMRRARGYSRFDWGVAAASPAYAILLRHLNEARELANFTGDAALYFHVHGDDAEAVEFLRDVLHEARALNVQPTFAVTHLVSAGCESLALARLEVIAPGLTIAPDDDKGSGPAGPGAPPAPGTKPSPRPATRAQVRALIAELLDDRPMAEGLRQAHVGERASQLDTAESFGRSVPVLRPMFRLDAVRIVRGHADLINAADQPNRPAAMAVMKNSAALRQFIPAQTGLARAATVFGPVTAGSTGAPVDYTRLLTSDVCAIAGATTGKTITSSMQVRADAHLAAASLAVQLYRADHDGSFPPSLEALVPAYLPVLPRDPLSPDDKPIGYMIARGALPGGGDRPLVYSVGLDGADDTVRADGLKRVPALPCFGTQKTSDEWRDVSRWAPAKTPEQIKTEADREKEADDGATQPVK